MLPDRPWKLHPVFAWTANLVSVALDTAVNVDSTNDWIDLLSIRHPYYRALPLPSRLTCDGKQHE
jgi:hypothetical protein